MFRASLAKSLKGARVAWFTNMGGIPFEPEITRVVNATGSVFADLGGVVEDAEPDFTGVDDAFPIFAISRITAITRAIAREHPTMFKEHGQVGDRRSGAADRRRMWRGRVLAGEDVPRRDRVLLALRRVRLSGDAGRAVRVDDRVSDDVNGVEMPTYIDWMRSCWYVTFMQCPAISVPAGFSARGLPVGLQIVGQAARRLALLQLAHAFEQATKHGARRPNI